MSDRLTEGRSDTGGAPVVPPTKRGPRMRRAARRRSGVQAPWLLLGVISLIALLVIGAIVYRQVDRRGDASDEIAEAIQLVEKADTVVVQVDGVVREEVTPKLAEQARETSEQIPPAREQLQRAMNLVDSAYPDLAQEERDRALLLREAAASRLEMLSQAPVILNYNVKSAEALPLAEQAWDLTVSARRLSDQAVTEYNKLTKAGVERSRTLNLQASSQLTSASALFGQADAAFPEADLERFNTYLTARVKLNRLSLDSDAAWLKGDFQRANEIIKDYNTEDKRAVELAKKLPASPRDAIAQAYTVATSSATESYYGARDSATRADERLRSR